MDRKQTAIDHIDNEIKRYDAVMQSWIIAQLVLRWLVRFSPDDRRWAIDGLNTYIRLLEGQETNNG